LNKRPKISKMDIMFVTCVTRGLHKRGWLMETNVGKKRESGEGWIDLAQDRDGTRFLLSL
jgi:hypothetical protein